QYCYLRSVRDERLLLYLRSIRLTGADTPGRAARQFVPYPRACVLPSAFGITVVPRQVEPRWPVVTRYVPGSLRPRWLHPALFRRVILRDHATRLGAYSRRQSKP